MGWSYVLEARRNHGTDHEERRELIEWRKFDDLYHEIAPELHYKFDEPEVVVNKEQLRKLLIAVATIPDYWAYSYNDEDAEFILPNVVVSKGFTTVERLAEIYHAYNDIVDEGWEIVFSGG